MLLLVFCLMAGDVNLDVAWERNLDEVEVYRARAVAVAEDGTVALIDRDQMHIVILDDQGHLKARVTAKGEGPGELQRPVEIAYCAWDQTFAVLDFANVRLSKWHKSGKFHSEHELSRNFFRPQFGQATSLFLLREPFARGQRTPSLVGLDLKQGQPKVLWEYKPEAPILFSKIGNSPEAGEIVWRWNPALVYGKGKDFLAVGFGREARVHLLNFAGQPLRKPIGITLPTYPVTDDQIEAAFDLMPANMNADLRAGLLKPKGWPVICNILVDGADRIWVVGAAPDLGQPHPFQIYDPSGDHLGDGKVAALPLAVTASAVYYLHGDEDLFLVKAAVRVAS